jgi:Zn-finger nucleic acid-binding protein
MRCVKCEGRLVSVRIDDVDVDQCDRCAGIWFDAHELERVLSRHHLEPLLGRAPAPPAPAGAGRGGPGRARRVGPAASPDDERRGRCPRCRGEGHLVRIASRRAEIHVDTCAVCGGKWLDGGEIDLLAKSTIGDALRRVVRWVLELDLP